MITKQLLREWEACWPDDKIAVGFGTRAEISPRDIADDDSIPIDDRLWVLCRCLWHLDESAARYFAIEQAATVAHLAGDEDEQAIYAGLLNDMMEIEDLPVEQRAAAWAAAWAAARAAARAAAWAAARAAAWAAAWDAARDAAWDAAWAAAWAAARAAAWAAARDAARDAARAAAWAAARAAAWAAARAAALQKSIESAIEWLGDYADGWEEP